MEFRGVDTNLKKMQRLDAEVVEWRKKVDELMRENKKLSEDYKMMQEKAIQTLNLTDQFKGTILILKKENTDLKNEIEVFRNRLNDVTIQKSRLTDNVNELTVEIEMLKKQIEDK